MSREVINFLRNVEPGYNLGWGGPEYSGWQDEQMSWKNTCYIGDWSFLTDIEISGPEAMKLFSDTSVNSFAKFDIGQAKHIVQCTSSGKVVAEGVLMRMSDDTFRTQSSPAMWCSYLLDRGGYNASWKQISTLTFQFQVSGPNALAVCEAAAGESLSDIRFMHFRKITIAGKEVYALRQGMAGEIGFELHGWSTDATAVYDVILAVGAKHGIRRLGRRTAMINHLEAAFPTGFWHFLKDVFGPETQGYAEHTQKYFDLGSFRPALRGSFEGKDIADYLLSPFELGWGKSVKFDHEFTGRAALEKEAPNPRRGRVTLEFNSADMIDIYASLFEQDTPYEFMDIPHQERWIAWADAVLDADGRIIGISSVPGYSLYFRKILTLAFIDTAHLTPGTQVFVLWGNPGTRQKKIRATVAPAPYKKDNRRVDLGTST